MNRARIEFLQWFGLVAAPLAWATQLVFGYFSAEAHCETTHWGSGWSGLELGLTLAAALVAVAAEGAAATVYLALRGVQKDAQGPPGRQRLFAIGALVGNVLFLVAILASGVTVVAVDGCRPA